ncbi:MAG: hypothetical protein Q8P41_05690 [Pseudomonadota bacterium]|nr:hypothetical protein [Pseudomonadota bacterium]
MGLLWLLACALGDPDPDTGVEPVLPAPNALITLVAAEDGPALPGGRLPILEVGSGSAPVPDAPDRELGRIGATEALEATITQGVHRVNAAGELDSHPGCEQPEAPQSTCEPAGWYGDAFVEVFGPDWGEDAVETDVTVIPIAEGEVVAIGIVVTPMCACTD